MGALFGTLRFATSGYLGHYGLSRNKSDITPDKIDYIHAWDRNDPISKYFTLGSTRHPMHHVHPSKHFYEIVKYPTSQAELPHCYEVMYLAALVPFLFFKIMDKKFDELNFIVKKNMDSARLSNPSGLTIKIL
jgi:alkane 1-monooxygenase